MARDSGMSTGPDGGGGGLGGLGGGGGFGGSRGTGAGGDNLRDWRGQQEDARKQAGVYTAEQRRLQMELNKALIDGDMDLAKQLQAEIAHASQNPTQGVGGRPGMLPPGFGGSGKDPNSPVHEGYYSLNDKHFAEKTFAAVTRGQYKDWEQRFLPRQRELMELAKNESLAKDQLARTDGLVANSLRQAQLGQDNRMARMGVATKQDSNDNQLGLRQSLITAGTKNATRTHEKDRQLGILTGADAGTREKLQDGGVT